MEENYQVKNSTTLSRISFFTLGIFIIFLSYLIISITLDNALVYPTLTSIFASIGDLLYDNDFYINLITTLFRTIIVILISLLISLIMSFIYILYKPFFEVFRPSLLFFKACPLAIISVYLFIVLGSQKAPYLITLLMVLPLMVEGFTTSIDNIDKNILLALKIENVSFIKKYFKIYLPMIMPYIIMTTLQSFGMGLKVMIMGEYISQTKNSLGRMIYIFRQNLEFNYLLGMLIIVVIIVFLFEFVIKKASKHLIK